MKKRRVKLAIAGLLGMALALGGCAKKNAPAAAGQETIDKIRLGIMIDNALVPDVGEAHGVFAKNGLELEVVVFAAGINSIDAISIGQLDVGFAADFAILNRIGGTQNSPLRIFTGYAISLNSYTLFSADPSVQKPADLAGKSVPTLLGTVYEYYYAQTFAKLGIPESRIKYLPVESPLEAVALVQNGTAGGFYAGGQAKDALKKMPGVREIGNLSDYVESTAAIYIASDKFLKENSRAAEKFIKSVEEIYEIILRDPEAAADLIYKTRGIPRDTTLLTLQMQDLQVDYSQQFYDAMDSVYQWAVGKGVIKYPYDLRQFINLDALKKVFPDRGQFK